MWQKRNVLFPLCSTIVWAAFALWQIIRFRFQQRRTMRPRRPWPTDRTSGLWIVDYKPGAVPDLRADSAQDRISQNWPNRNDKVFSTALERSTSDVSKCATIQ